MKNKTILCLAAVLLLLTLCACGGSENAASSPAGDNTGAADSSGSTGAPDTAGTTTEEGYSSEVIHAGLEVIRSLDPKDYEGTVYGIKSLAFMTFDRAPIYTLTPVEGLTYSVYANGCERLHLTGEFIEKYSQMGSGVRGENQHPYVKLTVDWINNGEPITSFLFTERLTLKNHNKIDFSRIIKPDGDFGSWQEDPTGLNVFLDAALYTPDGDMILTHRFFRSVEYYEKYMPTRLEFLLWDYDTQEQTVLEEETIWLTDEHFHFYEQEPAEYDISPLIDRLYREYPDDVLTELYGEGTYVEYYGNYYEEARLYFNPDTGVLSGALGTLIENCPEIIPASELYYIFQNGYEYPSLETTGYTFNTRYLGYGPHPICIMSNSDGTYTPDSYFTFLICDY